MSFMLSSACFEPRCYILSIFEDYGRDVMWYDRQGQMFGMDMVKLSSGRRVRSLRRGICSCSGRRSKLDNSLRGKAVRKKS